MSKGRKGKKPPFLADWRFGVIGGRKAAGTARAALSFRRDGTLVLRDEHGDILSAMALAPGMYIERVPPAADPDPAGDTP